MYLLIYGLLGLITLKSQSAQLLFLKIDYIMNTAPPHQHKFRLIVSITSIN